MIDVVFANDLVRVQICVHDQVTEEYWEVGQRGIVDVRIVTGICC